MKDLQLDFNTETLGALFRAFCNYPKSVSMTSAQAFWVMGFRGSDSQQHQYQRFQDHHWSFLSWHRPAAYIVNTMYMLPLNTILFVSPTARPFLPLQRPRAPHLRQRGVDLSLEHVPLVQRPLQLGLRLDEGLLSLPEGLQQLVSLVQHVDHQLLEVGLLVRAVRDAAGASGRTGRVSLADGRHHLAHHLPSTEVWATL